MVSFSFKPDFVPLIESGVKIQTIRSTQRCERGDNMHLYTGLRTKAARLIAVRPCVSVRPVIIRPEGLEVLHQMAFVKLGEPWRERFARADGFSCFDAMYDFFHETYGTEEITGFCHRWEKYPKELEQ